MTDDTERPPARDKTLSARVPPDVYKLAQRRARREHRSLSAILRAWLASWATGQSDSPPESDDEKLRAAKRPRTPAPKQKTRR